MGTLEGGCDRRHTPRRALSLRLHRCQVSKGSVPSVSAQREVWPHLALCLRLAQGPGLGQQMPGVLIDLAEGFGIRIDESAILISVLCSFS